MKADTFGPSRTRVLTALAHREPDQVPFDFWATDEVFERLVKELRLGGREELLRDFGVDLRYVHGPSDVFRPGANGQGERLVDLWGVERTPVTVGEGAHSARYLEVSGSPLGGAGSVAEVESYAGWPDPEDNDYETWASGIEWTRDCAGVLAGNRLDRTAQLKPAMYLRGVEQILLDLYLNPEIAEAIFARIRDYFMRYNRRVFEAAGGRFDIFMMGDDFGTQRGPMISLETWRKFFRAGFRQYIDLAHSFNLKVMHHTCGSVREFIPDFIDCGLDILQSLQPQAEGMDLAGLKRDFGRDIVLQGGIDIQGPLVHGSPADVRNEVRERMAAGKPGGGFIICPAHKIQPDAPTENIVALVEAVREFRA